LLFDVLAMASVEYKITFKTTTVSVPGDTLTICPWFIKLPDYLAGKSSINLNVAPLPFAPEHVLLALTWLPDVFVPNSFSSVPAAARISVVCVLDYFQLHKQKLSAVVVEHLVPIIHPLATLSTVIDASEAITLMEIVDGRDDLFTTPLRNYEGSQHFISLPFVGPFVDVGIVQVLCRAIARALPQLCSLDPFSPVGLSDPTIKSLPSGRLLSVVEQVDGSDSDSVAAMWTLICRFLGLRLEADDTIAAGAAPGPAAAAAASVTLHAASAAPTISAALFGSLMEAAFAKRIGPAVSVFPQLQIWAVRRNTSDPCIDES
jgi:hypothetical protein